MGSYKHIVIVGAGPIGLYMAIQLKRRGVQHITVIDPRANAYTRPGVLDQGIFELMDKQLHADIRYSSSQHIKDLERALYELAEKEGIHIEQTKFVGIEPQHVMVQSAINQTPTKLPCDMVFDASGSARAVVHAVNARAQEAGESAPLEIEHIMPVDVTNHLLAYVQMDPSLIEALHGQRKEPHDTVHALIALETIRDEFAWTGIGEPDFHFQKLNKNKLCLYFEAPSNLQPEQCQRWVNLMLQLKSGKENVHFDVRETSKKWDKKPHFTSFTVNPSRVKQSVYDSSDLPVIVPIGDAQIEPDYRIGFGVKSGVHRANAFLNAIKSVDSNGFEFDPAHYEYHLGIYINAHVVELNALYKDRKTTLFGTDSLKDMIKRLKKAVEIANPEEREVLAHRLHASESALIERYDERAKKNYKNRFYIQASDHYKKIIALCESDPDQSHETEHLKAYSNLVIALKMGKRTDEAINLCEKALSLFAENTENKRFFEKLRFNYKDMQKTQPRDSSKPSKKQ